MPSTVSPLQHSIYYKTYEKNVTACQKAKCFFHGMPRERDSTTGVHECVGTTEGVPRPVETKRPSE